MDKKLKAKQVKIESLYTGDLKKFGGTLRGKCPFHDDGKEPNFFIYTQTNSWFCFKCSVGGDAIAFIMKLKNIDFKEAITCLIN